MTDMSRIEYASAYVSGRLGVVNPERDSKVSMDG
jgi:hypothetical protein